MKLKLPIPSSSAGKEKKTKQNSQGKRRPCLNASKDQVELPSSLVLQDSQTPYHKTKKKKKKERKKEKPMPPTHMP
jgi:hypothetical protein